MEEGKSLQLHTSLVEQLPTLLRVYIGCGTVLYGDVTSADLIKIHIGSGKLSLMNYDDFAGKPLPRMVRRVKLNLKVQGLDVFEYQEEFTPPYLYQKSRFINEEFPCYAEQLAFDEALLALGIFDLSGYGPTLEEFHQKLELARWEVADYRLIRSRALPNIDDPCGRYLTYRSLIECGETQRATGLPNLPANSDSYTAIYELATKVLDPVIEYFGGIKLTYGFCSQDLAKHIHGRIAPALDQHAAYETNRTGRPICPRLGAAVDFIIEHENMEEVANWIVSNTPFDRLYFYGDNKSIHVSVGPENKREFIEMVQTRTGRLVPRGRKPRIEV